MQQQAMRQQAMRQQAMKQHDDSHKKNIITKIKDNCNNQTLQEAFLISILFIIVSTSLFKNNLSKIPLVSNDNNLLNTTGLLISSIIIAILFIIIRTIMI